MILLIDNYDSFVHNLARYFQRLGQETRVMRNDAIDVASVRRLNPQAIVLSPGPCTPDLAGASLDIVRSLAYEKPMLGVCLGHQTIAAAFGAQIIRSGEPMHGRTSKVEHQQTGLFVGLPNPMIACRYHSLTIDENSLNPKFDVPARVADGTIMSIAHRELPLFGVQFHPESILTIGGFHILENFLRSAKLECKRAVDVLDGELLSSHKLPTPLPNTPVTF